MWHAKRALKSRRSSTIGVVLAGVELYELPRVLHGVQSATQRAGYWVADALADIVTGVAMTVVMSGNVPNPELGFVELDQEP